MCCGCRPDRPWHSSGRKTLLLGRRHEVEAVQTTFPIRHLRETHPGRVPAYPGSSPGSRHHWWLRVAPESSGPPRTGCERPPAGLRRSLGRVPKPRESHRAPGASRLERTSDGATRRMDAASRPKSHQNRPASLFFSWRKSWLETSRHRSDVRTLGGFEGRPGPGRCYP